MTASLGNTCSDSTGHRDGGQTPRWHSDSRALGGTVGTAEDTAEAGTGIAK